VEKVEVVQKQLAIVKQRVWPISKAMLPLFIGAGCLWLLKDRLTAQTLASIVPTLKSLPAEQWIFGLLATCISFWALGRYDMVIHRHFNTGCPAHRASVVGAASIAVGQVVGMGVLTGALVRWRMLPEISFARASKIALTVALSFFMGLGFTVSVVSLVFSVPYVPGYIAYASIFLFVIIILSSLFNPFRNSALSRFRFLSLPAVSGILVWTLIDTTAAAFALYALMPETAGIGFSVLLPAYLAALTAALITGTPGGVGPFELTLLAFLPGAPEADVMAGVIAFRLIYYALPALIAAIILCRPFEEKEAANAAPAPALPSPDGSEFTTGPRAETGVCRQNNARILTAGPARLAVVSTPQTETALFDPIMGRPGFDPSNLVRLAKNHNKIACFYKISARYAAKLRHQGFIILYICDEAVLDPSRFSLEGSGFRQLRRKLGKAAKAGVVVSRAENLPLAEMAKLDREWQQNNGKARGFSMGRFSPEYLRRQRVYVARQGTELVGFISLHVGARELCLDLMRSGRDTPDGTMHQLIITALQEAANEGYTRLSLAALPPVINGRLPAENLLQPMLDSGLGGIGLSQFKTAFKPRREPLYAAARSWTGLTFALIDLSLAVRHPDTNPAQKDHEDIGFARARET
jgi:phosphatidylglycerol lysyltransferase